MIVADHRAFATAHQLTALEAKEIADRLNQPLVAIKPFRLGIVVTELAACRQQLQAAASSLGRGRLGTAVQEAASSADRAIEVLGSRPERDTEPEDEPDADVPAPATATEHLQLAHEHANAAVAESARGEGATAAILRELLTVFAEWIATARETAPAAPDGFPVPWIIGRQPDPVPDTNRPAARTAKQIRRRRRL